MCSIAWCDLTWEAFATLFTGVAAVGAATFVGLRQLAISNRLAALESQKLKADLFHERFAVYEATRKWLSYILTHAARATPEIRNDMASAIDRSRFLFEPDVYESLQSLYELGSRYVFASEQAANPNAAGNVDHAQQAFDCGNELTEKLRNLHGLFGDGMKLEASAS